MHRAHQWLRAIRTLLVGAGLLLAVLYGVSWKGLWWVTPRGSNVGLYGGTFVVRYWGEAASVSGLSPGPVWGDLSGQQVTFSPPPGSRNDTWSTWLYFVLISHGRTGPGPVLHQVLVQVLSLAWIAIALQAAGVGLMFVRTRPRPDECSACGYSLRGLSGDPHCPECGVISRQTT